MSVKEETKIKESWRLLKSSSIQNCSGWYLCPWVSTHCWGAHVWILAITEEGMHWRMIVLFKGLIWNIPANNLNNDIQIISYDLPNDEVRKNWRETRRCLVKLRTSVLLAGMIGKVKFLGMGIYCAFQSWWLSFIKIKN